MNSQIKTKVRVNDAVKVICGKDRGKEGKVISIDAHLNTVTVSGVNMAKKAMRRKRQDDKGGIIDIERPIHLSNVQVVSKAKELDCVTILLSTKMGRNEEKQ